MYWILVGMVIAVLGLVVWVYSLHVEAVALRGSVERMADAILVQDLALKAHGAAISGLYSVGKSHHNGKFDPSNN